ncbi:metallophosphoesterase [Paramagnetospirillum magneticum]|nr:metallophosphoesterase [Paramagnetospirillum magneticum]
MPADHEQWRRERQQMEALPGRSSILGPRPTSLLVGFEWLTALALRLAGLWNRGRENARRVRLLDLDLPCPGLPTAFDGFSILHLSDLHVGNVAGLEAELAACLKGVRVDLAVLTGDYQTRGQPSATQTLEILSPVLQAYRATEGTIAVLGNHDSWQMAEEFRHHGVSTLVNDRLTLHRHGAEITVLGLDDVNRFFTPAAIEAFDTRVTGFTIVLAHTPDLATRAAHAGAALYLCGHTHGGQICLPGGKAVFTALDTHQHLAAGLWRLENMWGYTSRGVGTGLPPVRFNCPGEATLFRLRSSDT